MKIKPLIFAYVAIPLWIAEFIFWTVNKNWDGVATTILALICYGFGFIDGWLKESEV